MALTGDKNTKRREGRDRNIPVKVGETIYVGGLVCLDANGEAVTAITATGLTAVGISKKQLVVAVAGDSVDVRTGIHCFKNSAAGDEITLSEIDTDCYIVDDETVAKTDGGATRSVCGKVFDVNSDGIWVTIGGIA